MLTDSLSLTHATLTGSSASSSPLVTPMDPPLLRSLFPHSTALAHNLFVANSFCTEQEAAIGLQRDQAALFSPLLDGVDEFMSKVASTAGFSLETAWATFLICQSTIDVSAALVRGSLDPPPHFMFEGSLPSAYPARPLT